MSPMFHKLNVKEIRRETEDSVSVQFEVPNNLVEAFQFEPGQYLTLRTEINGEDVRRSYSICSGLDEGELRVAIKEVPNGLFSGFANKSLEIGSVLSVMTPMGKFTTEINEGVAKSFVFFAAGSGITPIISLIKSILARAPKSDVSLIYGNKNSESIIFKEELDALKNKHMETFRIMHVLSRENIGNPLQKGRIDNEKVSGIMKTFLANQPIDEVFICGPEQLIFAVSETLESLGIAKEKIHFELFTSPSAIKKSNAIQVKPEENLLNANVTIIIDDEHTKLALDSNGMSILDAGHKAGADLPYACKGGVCCTCKAKIIEGSVKMDVNYALEKDEVEAGYILTCQAHPTSDSLVVSFDE